MFASSGRCTRRFALRRTVVRSDDGLDLSQISLLEAIDDAVTVLGRDGIVIAWNPAAEALYGWRRTRRRSARRRLPVPGRGSRTPRSETLSTRGRPGRATTWPFARTIDRARAHERLPVRNGDGDLLAIVTVSNDVSERRSLEEMLRQDEERLRAAFATARMGAWSWDVANDVVTWDEHMEARFGLSPGTFGGTFDNYPVACPSR